MDLYILIFFIIYLIWFGLDIIVAIKFSLLNFPPSIWLMSCTTMRGQWLCSLSSFDYVWKVLCLVPIFCPSPFFFFFDKFCSSPFIFSYSYQLLYTMGNFFWVVLFEQILFGQNGILFIISPQKVQCNNIYHTLFQVIWQKYHKLYAFCPRNAFLIFV